MNIQQIGITLTAAAQNPLVLPSYGYFVRCVKSDEDFNISIDDEPLLPFGIGRAISPKNPDGSAAFFNKVRVTRAAGAALASQEIVLIVGAVDYVDNRASIVGAVSLAAGQTIRETPAATLSGAAADVVLVAATNTLLIAANLTRRCVRITNTGTVDARISSVVADLTAGRGELVRAGEAREIFVTGAISARSTGTPTLNIGEEVF